MAKNTKRGTIALNPPFDKRMLSIGAPNNAGKALRRGWIATDNSVLPSGAIAGRVNFLFNPPQVQVSHPLNPSYQSADYQTQLSSYNAQWVGDTLGQAGEVGVSLLFDRTYELWDRSYAKGLAGQYGAYVDVLAMYKLLGIVNHSVTFTGNATIANAGLDPTSVSFGLFPQNPLRGSPICYLYLGPNSLKYRGFVDNLNVTYTHFSRQMVPMRVQIDLSMQMYMADITGDTTGGGTTTVPGPNITTPPPTFSYPPAPHKPGNGTHWGPVLP